MLQLTPAEAHYFIYTKDKILFEERKHSYELMRMQTFYQLMPYCGEKSRIKKPEDLMKFAWDTAKVVDINPAEYTEDAFLEADLKYSRLKVAN